MAQFTNYATLSYNGLTLTSNTVTGQLLETVSITKTATAGEYSANDDITYIVALTNSGETAVTDLTVTDDMGGYLFDGATVYPLNYKAGSLRYLIDGVLQPAPAVTAGPPLAVTGLSIPAGGSAVLIYEALTTAYAPPAAGGTVTNTATAAGAAVSSVSASMTLAAAEGAALSISKALSPAAVSPGGQLTYTFLIENAGAAPVEAADGAVLSDTFHPILSNLTVTLDGAAMTETVDYTYNPATGVFSTVAGHITLPAATFTQGTDGAWSVSPASVLLTISGSVQPTVTERS